VGRLSHRTALKVADKATWPYPRLCLQAYIVLLTQDGKMEILEKMDPKALTSLLGVLTALGTLAGAIFAIFKYFNYRSQDDEMRLVLSNFNSVVASLRSDNPVERLAGAILLRRFFDPKTEAGIKGRRPFWKEAVAVTTAILRGQPRSDFQKILADGLAFAPTLERADLQNTNLQLAYLGFRKEPSPVPGGEPVIVTTNLSHADFYRADLSRASLKGANAQGAVFYQSRMHNTQLSQADLSEANFFEADLQGANFNGCRLKNANFSRARNVPQALKEQLESGVYTKEGRFATPEDFVKPGVAPVFVSRAGCLSLSQQQRLASLLALLREEGIEAQMLDRSDYPTFGSISEVHRMMSGCAGAIILGFIDIKITNGTWRPGTSEEKALEDVAFTTAWNQIEAGIAITVGIPLLALRERQVSGGIFDVGAIDSGFYQVAMEEDWNASSFQHAFSNWCADVREQAGLLKIP